MSLRISDIVANTIIKAGGTSSQILMADGTVSTNPGSWITSSASISGNAATATALQTARTINGVSFNGTSNIAVPSLYDTNYRRITNPGGGEYVTQTSTVTGAIAVTLPVGWTDTMLRVTIKIYEYTTNESFEVHAGSYSYSGAGGNWANNPYAYIIGNPTTDRRFTVRFGYDSTAGKTIIYIGEIASTWAYPQVFVTEFQGGYAGMQVGYVSGWSIGFEASAFKNVTATISNCQVGYAATSNTANSVVLRDGSGDFSAGTITATLNGNASSATSATTSGNASTADRLNSVGITNLNTDRAAGKLEYYDKSGGTGAPSDNWHSYISTRHGNSGNQYGFQLANQFGTESLFFRGWDGTNPLSWRVVLHSGNYNSYSPTLTGGGASGFWGISIDGTVSRTVAAGSDHNFLYGAIADNDFFRVRAGGASNAGYLEIATADDGTEPIYVRQYTGVFATVARTLTLLDGSGNTSIPGSLTIGGNTAIHSGNITSYAIPISGGINMTGSYGLNDSKLYLRTNGDNNHFLWNADDDWEELRFYTGTGFRLTGSDGTGYYTFSTSNATFNRPLKVYAQDNNPISFTNVDAGSALYTDRGGRLLTSNGTGWLADGRDPILVIGGSYSGTERGRTIGLALHNETNANNTYSPLIAFSTRSNSGGYNTAYAAIMGKHTGVASGLDTNWASGELHFYAAGSTYMADTPTVSMTPSNILAYGNVMLHAGNYTSYTIPIGGGWYGANLPGSRWYGYSVNGGEIVFGRDLPNWGQMGMLIDGAYLAGENNGFWSLPSNNDWNGRRGMYWDGSYLNFTTNTPTARFQYIRADDGVQANYFYQKDNTDWYLAPGADLSLRVYGEISNSNYQQGVMQPGALNIGRTDTNYRWDGTNWASDVRLGILANCSEYWEIGIHDSGDTVMSALYFDGGSTITIGRNIGWGTCSLTVGGDITAFSDARVKENIKPIENALEKTLSLQGVSYNRTDGQDKRTKIGLIAQEVKEVVPEIVTEVDGGLYGVSYGNAVGLLIEAIKEQQKQIEELKSQIKNQ